MPPELETGLRLSPDQYTQKSKLSIRILGEVFPRLYGPRGKAAVDLFRWLRWVDDTADEDATLSREQKLKFIERQRGIVLKEPAKNGSVSPNEIEALGLTAINTRGVPKEEIRQQLSILLASIRDDVKDLGYQPRSAREARHCNWRANLPALQIFSLMLNGKPISPTPELMSFLDGRITLANLFQIVEDTNQGLSKLPFSSREAEEILGEPPDQRQTKVLSLYDVEGDKHRRLKEEAERKIRENRRSFFSLNIP